MRIHDDETLGGALRELSADQPPQPADRLSSVLRQSRRIHRTRYRAMALAMGGVAIVVAALIIVIPRTTSPTPPALTPTPVNAWPDRSLPDDQAVADGALRDWHKQQYPASSGIDQARWLFRGDVRQADGNTSYLAVFLYPAQGPGQELVLAQTRRVEVDDHGFATDPQPGFSPWVTRDAPVVYDTSPTFVGAYLGNGSSPLTDVLFVLADPAARELRFTLTPLPFAGAAELPPGVAVRPSGTLWSHTGLFNEDIGPLTGSLEISLIGADGESYGSGPLGFEGNNPALARPSTPDTPANFTSTHGTTAQSEVQRDGSVTGQRDFDGVPYPASTWVIYARCYGTGSLSFVFETDRGTTHGTVACDGQSHQPFPPTRYSAINHNIVTVTITGLNAYTYVVGTLS